MALPICDLTAEFREGTPVSMRSLKASPGRHWRSTPEELGGWGWAKASHQLRHRTRNCETSE